MEIIIAIAIVAIGVAIWFNRRAPVAPVVEPETFSDNGIKFATKEEAPAPVAETVPAPIVEAAPVATLPAKAPRAKKAPTVKASPKKAPAAKKPVTKKPAKSK
jgi:hypothetical protein